VILIGFWVSGAVVEKLGNYFDITTPISVSPHLRSKPNFGSPEAQTQDQTLRAGAPWCIFCWYGKVETEVKKSTTSWSRGMIERQYSVLV
jgi:hypothetical protein